jgi:hypothetical protein
MTLRCVNVRTLLQSAFKTYVDEANLPLPARDGVLLGGGPQRTPIEPGPAWIDSERYTIEAKAEGTVDRGMIKGPMLQIILEDRFQLKVHWEDREIPIYGLTVAKGRPKLKPFREGSRKPMPLPDLNGLSVPPPPLPNFRWAKNTASGRAG